MADKQEVIDILTSVYAYNHAYKLAKSSNDCSEEDLLFLLEAFRRDVN